MAHGKPRLLPHSNGRRNWPKQCRSVCSGRSGCAGGRLLYLQGSGYGPRHCGNEMTRLALRKIKNPKIRPETPESIPGIPSSGSREEPYSQHCGTGTPAQNYVAAVPIISPCRANSSRPSSVFSNKSETKLTFPGSKSTLPWSHQRQNTPSPPLLRRKHPEHTSLQSTQLR